MQASKVTREALEQAARDIGVQADIEPLNAKGTRFKVKLFPEEWQDPLQAFALTWLVVDSRISGPDSIQWRGRTEAGAVRFIGTREDGIEGHYMIDSRQGRRRSDERGDRKYQRLSASAFNDTRRVHAVCWHGFRDYFRAVFATCPDAVFHTSLDTWKGSADFEARYRASGHRNVGAPIYPRMMAEVCRCGQEGLAV